MKENLENACPMYLYFYNFAQCWNLKDEDISAFNIRYFLMSCLVTNNGKYMKIFAENVKKIYPVLYT